MHYSNPEKGSEGVCDLVVRLVDYSPVRGVGLGHDIGERPLSPVVGRVESLKACKPCVHCGGDVSCERAAGKALVELVHVLLDRDDKILEVPYLGPRAVVVHFHLLSGHLVRVGVHLIEPGGTGCH